MSLKLLLDECIQDKRLANGLRQAGHDVETASEAALIRKSDHAVFEYAIARNRRVLTTNCADFVALHEIKLSKRGVHPGILLVYRANVAWKEMTYNDIVGAISKLESYSIPLENQWHCLNQYK